MNLLYVYDSIEIMFDSTEEEIEFLYIQWQGSFMSIAVAGCIILTYEHLLCSKDCCFIWWIYYFVVVALNCEYSSGLNCCCLKKAFALICSIDMQHSYLTYYNLTMVSFCFPFLIFPFDLIYYCGFWNHALPHSWFCLMFLTLSPTSWLLLE